MREEARQGDDAAMPPLLLLPGLVGDDAVWAPVRARLGAAVDCRVVPTAPASSLGAMAEHVLAVAPREFALAGHSLGGRVALEVVRRAPERVRRLALLDTGWRPLPAGAAGAEERAGRLALIAIARKDGMRAMGRAWVRPMVHPARRDDAGLIETILAMIERHAPERFAEQIEALLARPDASAVLSGIGCPTLVLCGAEDAWSPFAQHEAMVAMIPGPARLVAIPDCGHMAPMERPDAVAAAFAEWLGISVGCRQQERQWAT